MDSTTILRIINTCTKDTIYVDASAYVGDFRFEAAGCLTITGKPGDVHTSYEELSYGGETLIFGNDTLVLGAETRFVVKHEWKDPDTLVFNASGCQDGTAFVTDISVTLFAVIDSSEPGLYKLKYMYDDYITVPFHLTYGNQPTDSTRVYGHFGNYQFYVPSGFTPYGISFKATGLGTTVRHQTFSHEAPPIGNSDTSIYTFHWVRRSSNYRWTGWKVYAPALATFNVPITTGTNLFDELIGTAYTPGLGTGVFQIQGELWFRRKRF